MTDYNSKRACRASRVAATAVVLGLLSAILAGCSGAPRPAFRQEFVPFTPEQKSDLEMSKARSYRIQEGDLLKVYFAYERELNQDGVVVLSDGSVGLIGVDTIKLAGLTLTEADSLITLAYSREYKEPALSVMVQETSGRRVYVFGEVRNPGLYKLPSGTIDVMGAVTLAGGYTGDAQKKSTLVVRVTTEGYEFQEIDMDAFGTVDFAKLATVPLQNYDIIYVPRSAVGDFAYFSKSVLVGLSYVTRMFYDIRYISTGSLGRY